MVSGAAYVLYYIRKDFFPQGNIDYDAIRLKLSNTASANNMVITKPLGMITAAKAESKPNMPPLVEGLWQKVGTDEDFNVISLDNEGAAPAHQY